MSERIPLAGRIRSAVERRRAGAVELLGRLVDLEGGSEDKAAVDRVGRVLREAIEPLGFACEVVPQSWWGDHLVLRRGGAGPALLLGGHLDTTFSDYSELPRFRVEGGRAMGPGSADMRGGLVVIAEALAVLAELGALGRTPLWVALTSDEERGAPTARELFARLAAETRWALFFECAGPRGEVVVGRRGKASGRVAIEGRAAHAAERDLERTGKASALLELAHQVIALEALDGVREGCSVNVGRARGGQASNTVARRAELEFDFRYLRGEDLIWFEEAVAAVAAAPRVAGCSAHLEWTSARPVWEPSDAPAQRRLLEALGRAAGACGIRLAAERRWGTADASFFAAAGVPTVDGLGPTGSGDHSEREEIVVESLHERIQLVALAICELDADREGRE